MSMTLSRGFLSSLVLGTMAAVFVTFASVLGGVVLSGPAQAQFFPFFDDRYPFMDRRRAPREMYQPRERPPPPADYSRAPPPTRKADQAAQKTIVVLGDSMADWLAYGLEEAFSETPEVAIVRKHRTISGLIRNEARTDSHDWVQAARDLMVSEKADFIVVMLGLNDRQSIRERLVRQVPPGPQVGGRTAPNTPPVANTAPPPKTAAPPTPGSPQADLEQPPEEPPADAPAAASPSIIAPEPSGATATHEFRSERWAELYAKRVDDMVAVLKAKNVPVYWVGVPAIRGTRSTSDLAYLNDLYRSRAERAGAMYIDPWDGFVDDNGNFAVQGPDVEGQTRRLRSADGVHFTKAGARKLAHFVEREIQRALVARPVLVSLPAPEEPQSPAGKPGTPAARPAAGPIIYLTGAGANGQELLGGGLSRTPALDPVVAKVLQRGEVVTAPAGRADDFVWPRREITMSSVANIAEPTAPAPPGSPAARAAAAAGAAAPAPVVVKPVPQKRVASPRPPPPSVYYPPPPRSFWFGGIFR